MKATEFINKALTEAEFDEAAGKKDACYHKVKSSLQSMAFSICPAVH